MIATFNVAEEDNKVKEEAKAAPVSDDKPLIVAVTACTTGIAHTYMAEEASSNKVMKWVSLFVLKQMVLQVSVIV